MEARVVHMTLKDIPARARKTPECMTSIATAKGFRQEEPPIAFRRRVRER